MEFKPYLEVTLPPEKGTGIRTKKSTGSASREQPPATGPREFQVPGSSSRQAPAPASATQSTEERQEEKAPAQPPSPEPAGEQAPAQKEENEKKQAASREKKEPQRQSPQPAPEESRQDQRQDQCQNYIIAYNGTFIGHYRSSRRVTNRTALQRVARVLQAMIEPFDPTKVELFKPVPINVELPESVQEEINDDYFSWFAEEKAELAQTV